MSDTKQRMRVGINYPWKNYGWDFGIGPWGMRRAWEASLVDELRMLRKLGVHAVRWFILGDAMTYGTREGAPTRDPARPWHGHPQWRFTPPTGDAVRPILEDFRVLLECFKKAADDGGEPVRLMPVVLDFAMFFPGNFESGPFKKSQGPTQGPPDGFVKNGRADLAYDEGKSRLFIDHLLTPMVTTAAEPQFKPLIHSFDLCNEPEWCTWDGPEQQKDPLRTLPVAKMKQLLHACAYAVRPHHTATVGFAEHETNYKWDAAAMGLGLWQFHYYRKPHEVPEAAAPVRTVVGEFASAPGHPKEVPSQLLGQFMDLPGDRTWPELGGAWGDQSVGARLGLLDKKGFSEAFVWSMNAADRSTRWDDATRNDIARFTAAK